MNDAVLSHTQQYKLICQSREVGAIGDMTIHEIYIEAESPEHARELLRNTWDYSKRDHLLIMKVIELDTLFN